MYGLIMMLVGALTGAGAMYFLDPRGGGRRRALLRDQMVHMRHEAADSLDARTEDAKNRVKGTIAEAQSRLQERMSDEAIPNQQLEARVRSEIGRHVQHTGALDIRAEDGAIVLSGPVLADEVDTLISSVKAVRGVTSVENRLQVHDNPEDIPALQG